MTIRKRIRSLARCRRLGTFLAALAVVASAGPAAGAASAVVVSAAPTWPIPANAPIAPPQIPVVTLDTLPAAGAMPPADQIADPVTPSATCGGWQLQSNYGNRWAAGSSW
jgi:hypothetical protein